MSLELVSLDVLQEIAHDYGYAAVFFGILLENTGIPLPGETITLIGGFLAGNGELRFWGVLGSALSGAVIGDSIGYWVGALGGWPLLTRVGKVFRVEESQLIEVREQFSRNAAKAVFLGRFIALLRIFAGPLAGIAGMPYSQFLIFNVSGAAVWAAATVSLSFFVGRIVPLETLITGVAQFGLIALAVAVGAIALSILIERRAQLREQAESQD